MRAGIASAALLLAGSFAAAGDPPPDPAAEARALAEKCAASPDDLEARLRLGNAWLAAHEPSSADRAYAEVLARDPKSAPALFGRGRAAQDEGRWEEAARFHSKAVEADPAWEPARTRLALVYALSWGPAGKELDDAYAESLALPPASQDPILWDLAVYRALDLRDPGLAVERARELQRRFPESPWGPGALAWAFARQGKDREAEEAYQELARRRAGLAWPPQRTRLYLPFEGRWYVLQGPGGTFSHRTHRSSDAWDFQALDQLGRTYAEKGRRNEDYYGFGRPVLAPADGWVVETRDGVPDNEPGQKETSRTYGNYVVLEHEPGEFSRLLHLKRGSVRVKAGQRVARGQPVGQCGNSGHSSEPHLHFDLCTGRPPADASRPAAFVRYVRIRRWEPLDVADGCPGTDEWVEPYKP